MPRRIALIVGVSQYEPHTKLGNLSAPINDAQRVYDVLSTYGGFDMLYPLPLADGKVGSSGKVNAQTLREELRKILNPQASEEVELAVFYFSGHGVSHHGMASYLSATDEPLAVPLSFIIELVENSTVKNVCVWLDCCHSGEVLKFKTSEKKSFCIVAASTADEEALARKGQSLLTEILCEALTPDQDRPEIRVLEFVDYLEAHRKNLPQQILFRGDTPFTLTQYHGEVSVKSPYPPEHPPYKGLLTFTQADREFFFGRDGMIQQLLDRLSASRFVPLLGASGSGKSSLVLAGLLPQLPESDWQVLVIRPTAQPLQNVRDTLVRGFPDAQVGTVATGTDLQREVLKLVAADKRLLLVVDQFEEVFTECRDEAARTAFIACLLEALDGDNPLHLVLTLRADFLGHCTEQAYAGLGQRLQHHALLLVAPAAAELREAIARPLALVGMRCEQALEDELVDQTLYAKGSLPLLQYVLEKLWQSARQERSRELTLAMYQQLGGQHGGGLRGVLNEKADAFYQQLEPQQQRLMEWLMVELVQVNEGQEDTRRTVTLQELHTRQPQYTAALDALLTQLVTHERLLTQDHDDHGQATITVAHEALIRDWQRLRGWLESNREIKSWRLRLEDSITAWKNNVSGSLLREKRLAEAQRVLDKHPDSLLIGQDERAFIVAGIKQQQNEQAKAQREKRIKRNGLIAFIFILLLVFLATYWQRNEAVQQREIAVQQNQEAKRQQQIAIQKEQEAKRQQQIAIQKEQEANQQRVEANFQAKTAFIGKLAAQAETAINSPSFANGYLTHGMLLAVQAFHENNTSIEAKAALHHCLTLAKNLEKTWYGHNGDIMDVAFNPEGKFVISASRDDTLKLWDAKTGKAIGQPWHGHKNGSILKGVSTTAFSPDGKLVVSGGVNHTLIVWLVETGMPIHHLLGHENIIFDVEFSPNGKQIISGSADGNLRLWDVETGKQIGKPWGLHKEFFRYVKFTQDGKYVISEGSDYSIQKWSVETGKSIKKIWQGDKNGRHTSFSSDGRYMVNAQENKLLQILDIEKGKIIAEALFNYEGEISALAFSPNRKSLVSGSSGGIIQLWDVFTGKAISRPLRGHEGAVSALAFSPDGKHLVSGGTDWSLKTWDLENEHLVSKSWIGHEKSVRSVVFSNDGKYVISGSEDGTLRLWDMLRDQTIGKAQQISTSYVLTLAVSPDGKYIASGDMNNALRLWDSITGDPLSELPMEDSRESSYGAISALAFSPDSKFIIGANWNKTLSLWNISEQKIIGKSWRGHEDRIQSVAFSPDGNHVISAGGADRTLRLWDIKTGKIIDVIDLKGIVKDAAFSPDGKYIIISTVAALGEGIDSNTLQKWDIKTKAFVGKPWYGNNDGVYSISFIPSGEYIISGGGNTLRLWDAVTGRFIGEPWRGHESGVNDVAFSPDGKFVVSGSDDTTLRLWDADPESWAKKACSIVNRNFSLAEWQRFIGDALPYQKTCPDLPAPGEDGWVEPYVGG